MNSKVKEDSKRDSLGVIRAMVHLNQSLSTASSAEDIADFSSALLQLEQYIQQYHFFGTGFEQDFFDSLQSQLFQLKRSLIARSEAVYAKDLEQLDEAVEPRLGDVRTDGMPREVLRSVYRYILGYGGDPRYLDLVKRFYGDLPKIRHILSLSEMKSLEPRLRSLPDWKKVLVLRTFLYSGYLAEFPVEQGLEILELGSPTKAADLVFLMLLTREEGSKFKGFTNSLFQKYHDGLVEELPYLRRELALELLLRLRDCRLEGARLLCVGLCERFTSKVAFEVLLHLAKDPSGKVKSRSLRVMQSKYSALFQLNLVNITNQRKSRLAREDIEELDLRDFGLAHDSSRPRILPHLMPKDVMRLSSRSTRTRPVQTS